jgi:methionyl aminopeptidase
MNEKELEKWRKAGKIAAEALKYGQSLIKKGSSVRDVCDKVDKKIVELGALPAWPTQISLNSVAAHYTPDMDDEQKFNDELACIDVGAHIDGYIGDCALTVDLSGKNEKFLKAVQDALSEGIKTVKIGIKVSEIGKIICKTIEKHGLNPIRNLGGHGISEFNIHDSPRIPNFDDESEEKIEKGKIYAIEPFATDGQGLVKESERANIFSLTEIKPVRSQFTREIIKCIDENFGNLPFTTRWLSERFGIAKTNLALRELERMECLQKHPPLVEQSKGMVAQWEKTIYIGENSIEILTEFDP